MRDNPVVVPRHRETLLERALKAARKAVWRIQGSVFLSACVAADTCLPDRQA
jgi:hypothetical protein